MTEPRLLSRSLDRIAVPHLSDYVAAGGGAAVARSRELAPSALIDAISDAGLRGRGGAGFPTGRKLRAVAAAHSDAAPTTVVVNAAEGEPGTFKDRAILRANPYRVLEGAVVAAKAVGGSEIRVGIKASFGREVRRLAAAIEEATAAGWFEGIRIGLVLGPGSYLFGEETAMLEVMEERQPFPRVTPPFRRGIEDDDMRSAGGVHLATVGGSDEPPAAVDNVETLANVALVVANGAEWFREVGTGESPGTIVCTISGATRRHGVGEVAMGTTLREAVELIGWGPRSGHSITAVLSGTANPIISADLLDTPLTHEAMSAAATGLGSAGFIVFDEESDPVAIAQGVARFLAVESCGQCEPCKRDGGVLAELLRRLAHSDATDRQMNDLRRRVETVAIGARCNLARQQADVVGGLLRCFGDEVADHLGDAPPAELVPVVPVSDIVGGRAILDVDELRKQPDWSDSAVDSGAAPAARLGNTPVRITATEVPARRRDWTSGTLHRHPLESLDEAHELLDRLLVEALGQDPGAETTDRSRLGRAVRLHVEVADQILYRFARSHGGDAGEVAADRAERHDAAMLTLVERVESSCGDACANALKDLSPALRRHADDEDALVRTLRASLGQPERALLADALAGVGTAAPSPDLVRP